MSNALKRIDSVALLLDRLRLAALLTGLALAAFLLPVPWQLMVELAPRRIAPGQDLDGVLTAVALGAASIAVWLLISWILVIGALTLAASTPGALGRNAHRVLNRVTPGFLRRSIALGISVGALTGMAAGTAPSTAGAPAATSISIDTTHSSTAPQVLAAEFGGSTTRAALAVAAGVDRVGDRAKSFDVDGVGGLVPAEDSASVSTSARTATGTSGTAARGVLSPTPSFEQALPATGGPSVDSPPPGTTAPGTTASGTTAPGTTAPGTAAPGTAALDVDWPVHRPAPVREVPVDLDWPSAATVVVHRGDSLWSIAADQLGPTATDAQIDAAWRSWYAANRTVIGDDPDLILPGRQLQAPPAQIP